MLYESLEPSVKMELFRKMHLSRAFEEKVNALFMKGLIHGTTHLGIGQEAGHAGLSAALDQRDWMMPTHRGHGFFLGRGGDPQALMDELFGLRSGSNKGLGGSMHLIDLAHNNLGSSGVVAGSVPIAVGVGMALKQRGLGGVGVVLLGDGACNQGMALESFNLSSVWGSPVLFFCENNQYAMSAPASRYVAGGNLAARAASFGIESVRIDGNDVQEVFDAVSKARDFAEANSRPYFIESLTYRWLGHSKSDQRKYRTKEEEEDWRGRDPIARNRECLLATGQASSRELDRIESEAIAQVEEVAAASEARAGNPLNVLTLQEAAGLGGHALPLTSGGQA